MKVLAWDVGILNLAYCILEKTETTFQIIDWKVIAFIEGDYRKMSPEALRMALIEKLEANKNFLEVDTVLIENQPVLKNPTMKSISSCLFDYFLIRGKIDTQKIKSVLFSSPINKLRLNILEKEELEHLKNNNKSRYTLNKKIAISSCQKIIPDFEGDIKNNFFNSKKKDDYADCFLLAYHYFKKLNV